MTAQPFIAIQMDPLSGLNPATDSTMVLALEAQARGYGIFCYQPHLLSFEDGGFYARGQQVVFFNDPARPYEAGETETRDLAGSQAVLIRQDPPFDMAYVTSTYLLERLARQHGVAVANDPAAIRDCPEKWFVTEFAEFIPPTLISADPDLHHAFRAKQGDIVLKPFYGYGGNAVFHIRPDDPNFAALLESAFQHSREPLIAQRFLPEIRDGDKRILLVDGKVEGVIGRMPREGEIRANMRVGGQAGKTELTPRQQEICDSVGPELARRGLFFVGLDLIGDYLIEINVTSPTGLRAVHAASGQRPEQAFWDKLEQRLR